MAKSCKLGPFRTEKLTPLTYVFAHLDVSQRLLRTFDPGVTWGGWTVPVWLEIVIVLGMGLGLMAVAILEFRRAD